jgi:patatin-related protein
MTDGTTVAPSNDWGSRPVLTDLEPALERAPVEELRLAVVLNGGVSLAVWMGGAAFELNRLSFADSANRLDPYGALLDLARTTAVIDVIAGSSAGGINGAALALGEANSTADLGRLRELWADQGRVESLLRRPFHGQPASLLRGDEYFLPQLGRAMEVLSRSPVATGRRIDLTVTTTLLHGVPEVTVDALGQAIPDEVHTGLFRFRSEDGMFGADRLEETARALGLAARCSAGFPGTFEPSFVPVDCPAQVGEVRDPLRPDLGEHASWADGRRGSGELWDRSRFVVDGGLLANTPTRPALEAIDTMPVEGPARRVLLLVHPHAPAPRDDRADRPTEPPSFTASTLGLLGPLAAQGSRNFVHDVDEHNRRAAARRGGRAEVLHAAKSPADLRHLVHTIWPHYKALRIRRAACDLAARAPAVPGCSPERIRTAIEEAHRLWYDTHHGLPYLPASAPKVGSPGLGWAWGTTTAIGVADAAADLLRRAAGVATAEVANAGVANSDESSALETARQQVSTAREAIKDLRTEVDRLWWPLDAATASPLTPSSVPGAWSSGSRSTATGWSVPPRRTTWAAGSPSTCEPLSTPCGQSCRSFTGWIRNAGRSLS